MTEFHMTAVGVVRSTRTEAEDDNWDAETSSIELLHPFDDRALAGLDAIDGTPVIDIKPYMEEFAPRGQVAQPAWAAELMNSYWRKS